MGAYISCFDFSAGVATGSYMGQLHAVSVAYLIPFELVGGGLFFLGGLFYRQWSRPSCPMPEDTEQVSDAISKSLRSN